MPKSRITFRSSPNSILKPDSSGTRLVVNERKLEARLLELVKSTPPKSLAQKLINSGPAAWALVPDGSRTLLVELGTGCQLLDFQGKPITGPKRAIPSAGRPYRQDFFNHVATPGVGEAFVAHMYLDKKGNVTIGYGHLIPDLSEALRLSSKLVHKGTRRSPSRMEIEADFLAVRNSGLKNADALVFDTMTKLEMSQADATVLALDDIDERVRQIKHAFPYFDTYPHPVKLGLQDMVFNLGIGNTLGIFTKFSAAIRRRDWTEAANQTNRLDVASNRNALVRGWFLDAAREEPHFVNPNCIKQVQPSIK